MTLDDRGPELAVVVAVFLGLSLVTVALRCYVRAHILKAFQVEDWVAVAAMGTPSPIQEIAYLRLIDGDR
ncbi:hypothetical protein Daesc_008413 [Daldinia eschscholtzii]|uniref:Uncharacterized protein n=1 Tax=Daldinia eschscholtzii TaxID=292717 RepID=A0AAX6MBL5_9PEZI